MNKYLNFDGTIRATIPSETLERIRVLTKTVGISRVANVTGLDDIDIPVVVCIRPMSKHLTTSQGKGLTVELAEISAIMEAVEAYHIENPKVCVAQGSFVELKTQGKPALNPNVFARSFDKKDLTNTYLQWAQAIDFKTKKICYIPHVLTCLDSTQYHKAYNSLLVSTNGLAAGNCVDEALCHSLYEIIERDALIRWREAPEKPNQKQVNINSIDDDINKQLIYKIQSAGLELAVWEITSAVGIPSFHCVIYDLKAIRGLGYFAGSGSHLSKPIALSRAITEALQARLSIISGSRDDIYPDYYLKNVNNSSNHQKFTVNEGKLDYQQCTQPSFDKTFGSNVSQITDSIYHNGFQQVLIVDHTKQEINIPVIQVFIPGMKYDGKRM